MSYYPFKVKCCDKCNGSCSTQNGSSDKICILKKKEDGNVKVVNMITRKNESKSLTEHISCDGKCRFDGGKFNLNQI